MTVLGALAIVRVAAWPLARATVSSAPEVPSQRLGADSGGRISAESLTRIVARDVFRIGRRPAAVAYDPVRLAEPVAPRPPRPALILAGVLDGVHPSAVVEGFPGIDGSRVVRVGDVISDLRVKRITKEGVVIVGLDTTWVLKVREPWN